MARFYYLLAVFERERRAANFSQEFEALELALADGLVLPCTTDLFQSANGLWWVLVFPEGISLNLPKDGPPRLNTTAQLDEVATLLYQHLAEQESFLAAIAGWEVAELFLPEGASGYPDLRLEPAAFSQAGWNGLVIPIATWLALGEPDSFYPFRPGYVWRPYQSLGISGW